ncbi:MAG: DMT family transporter [Betaproteobacteria bacterium]|nr:DMT family transporter [Betaproteobacteria bacterium]
MSSSAPPQDAAQRLAWAFPGLFVLLWSTGYIGAKLGLPYAEPATFLSVRFLGVIAVLVPLCWFGRAPWPATGVQAAHMAFAGVLLQGGYLGGIFYSIHTGMPLGVSALIAGIQPILTAVLSAHMLGERTNLRQWLGLALGVAGVALVVREKYVFEGVGAVPVLFSVLGLVSITLGAVWQKRYCARIDLRTGAAIQFIAALAVVAPLALLFESNQVRWTGEFVFALAYLVVVLSLGAVFLLFWLIRHGAATKVASLMYLVPPCTALIAWQLFGETYTLFSAAGMALAMLAVWLVTKG